jgi:hypothetical protein
MRSITKKLLLLAGSAALVASSTAAVASAPSPQPSSVGPWTMLSMLTPSGAVALGEASAAAQPQPDVPPAAPPPMADSSARGGMPTPPLPVIALWLADIGLMVWIATRHHHHVRFPNSPA